MIDVYNGIISTDLNYIPEYLVKYDFIINEFKKYNIHLVESDTFDNMYQLYYMLLSKKNNIFSNLFKNIEDYYNKDIYLTNELLKISRLIRFYVFKKLD